MPQIGWFELLIIVVVAVLVIGPKEFPIVLKKIGSWIRTVKSYFSEVQSNLNQITDIEEDQKKFDPDVVYKGQTNPTKI